jgi:hypothetical protein
MRRFWWSWEGVSFWIECYIREWSYYFNSLASDWKRYIYREIEGFYKFLIEILQMV